MKCENRKKIVVLSDSHGNIQPMLDAVRSEKPDLILHLGDVSQDAKKLHESFPDIPMEMVCGNCDYHTDAPIERVFTYEGKKIFMTHGHRYNVKNGLLNLKYAAREKQADIVLFGHTHLDFCDDYDHMFFLNPGSVGAPAYIRKNSYGVLIIENGQIFSNIVYI